MASVGYARNMLVSISMLVIFINFLVTFLCQVIMYVM